MGFSASRSELEEKFATIPSDTDILVTHLPPLGIRDLSWVNRQEKSNDPCSLCQKVHPSHSHWGSKHLLAKVQEIRPKVHVYGYVTIYNIGSRFYWRFNRS